MLNGNGIISDSSDT